MKLRMLQSVWLTMGMIFGLFILGLLMRAMYLAIVFGRNENWGGETVGILFVGVLYEGYVIILFVIAPTFLLISFCAYMLSVMKKRTQMEVTNHTIEPESGRGGKGK